MDGLWADYERSMRANEKKTWLEKRKANPNNKKEQDASNEDGQIKEEETERDGLER